MGKSRLFEDDWQEGPLFGDLWYDTPRPDELRREVQAIYRLLQLLHDEVDEIEARIAAVEP